MAMALVEMPYSMAQPWLNLVVATALGLLIGLERERSKGEGLTRRPAGIRTFALVSLFGAVATHLGGPLFLLVATILVALLTAIAYGRSRETDPGLTTEVGLVLTPLVGGLAMTDMRLATALGVVIAVVFAAKTPLHKFVKGVLTGDEVNDGLIFAIATFVIWPQLPDRFLGPWQAINPSTLWLMVILVMAIGACGHVANRLLGPRFGLPIAGLASGFISSTATIGSMASVAAHEATLLPAAVAGASLSSVATFVQMAVLLAAISMPTLASIWLALAAGGAGAAIYGAVFTWRALRAPGASHNQPGRAFSLMAALLLASTMAVMLVLSAALQSRLGERGAVLGAALAGAVDTHAAAISVASLVAAAKIAPQDAVLPILAAMTSNSASKIVVAISTGSRDFAWRIIPGVVLSIAAAWLVALVVRP